MTNRLANSSSLYLRKHAENPVDWWPWCDEALAAAERENKPIFLSIGYSSCHWCTVMEGEAFSDEAIAQYLNANFLPIKVDREERPDIDSLYMQALQMIAGQGGWPLNIFLTPGDRIPFYGGTYFPVDPRYGRPGFLQILEALRRLYDTDPEKVASVKSQILAGLQQSAQLSVGTLSPEVLPAGIAACGKTLMPFDMSNRFPMIPYALLVLHGDRLLRNVELETPIDGLHLAHQRALNLVTGGIFDHVAGGFHRYTVDASWTVPHFEKMLYDNGLILEFLSDVWRSGKQEAAIARAVDKTVAWLKREMRSPAGFFYAAQDADNFASAVDAEPEEGDFYVWKRSELETLLDPEELTELEVEFTVSDRGNFEGRNVLQRKSTAALSQIVEKALAKLFQARYGNAPEALAQFQPAVDAAAAKSINWPGRIPPVTDTKMIVAWNSLTISGLAKAAVAFNRPDYLELAIQAAEYIWQNQQSGQTFYRLNYDGKAEVLAQSEDYALFIKALLDMQQASLAFTDYRERASEWLERAIALQSQFDQQLSAEQGGYLNATSEELILQERAYQDSAVPAANGIAIASLVRLFLLTENPDYLDQAEIGLQSFFTVLEKAPRACPSLLKALDWFTYPTLIRTTAEQIPELTRRLLPTAIIKLEAAMPKSNLIAPDQQVIALVCQGLSCKAPATDIATMTAQIEQSQGTVTVQRHPDSSPAT